MRAGLLPGRREVQTGGLSKEESPPYQRNPWRLCWAHHHLLWPTLKACWEHLKLRSGATPTFPLHYSRISSLHSFLGPLPPPILKSLPPKNSVALPRVVRDSILSMNARVSNKLGPNSDSSSSYLGKELPFLAHFLIQKTGYHHQPHRVVGGNINNHPERACPEPNIYQTQQIALICSGEAEQKRTREIFQGSGKRSQGRFSAFLSASPQLLNLYWRNTCLKHLGPNQR